MRKWLLLLGCFSFICFFGEQLDLPEGYELYEEECKAHIIEEEPLPQVAYLETVPSAIVAGCVNEIKGSFSESQVDLTLPGPKPLVLQRSWCSSDKTWHFSHKPLLHIGQK